MSGIHISSGGKKPVVVGGDIVGGDKTTIVVGAAVRAPTTLLEKAEEMVLDAEELTFGKAAELLRGLRAVRKATRAGDKAEVEKALGELEAKPGSKVITIIIQEIRQEMRKEVKAK